MTRRRRGEGSIYKIEHEGKPTTYGGYLTVSRRQRTYRYGRTSQEVRLKLDELRAQIKAGKLVTGDKRSVAVFLTQWLDNVSNVGHGTLVSYRNDIAHCTRLFGTLQLSELTPERVQTGFNTLLLSSATVNHIMGTFKKAMKQAVVWRLLASNPCDGVERPKRLRKRLDMQTFTAEELQTLLRGTKDTRWHALYFALGTTGMRTGEARGLTWEDIDWTKGTIRIARSLQERSGEGFWFVSPKTAAGTRTVKAAPPLIEALRSHRKRQLEERLAHRHQDKGLIFPRESDGGALSNSTLTRHFKSTCIELGLPKIRVHDLRHTAATLLLQNGVPMHQVAAMLGHSSPAITMTIYAHTTQQTHDMAADVMTRLVGEERAG